MTDRKPPTRHPLDPGLTWDDEAEPSLRLRTIANQIAGMVNADEITGDRDALRLLSLLPAVLLDIAGDVGVLISESVN